jgi:preprotein translocase subunit Sec61beta
VLFDGFHAGNSPLYVEKSNIFSMAKKQGGRLLSSAGLVNYYESEDRRAVHVSPVTVMIIAAAIGIVIYILDLVYKG